MAWRIRSGQLEPKQAALATLGPDADSALVALRQLLHRSEPQSDAILTSLTSEIGLEEGGKILWRHAGTCISDLRSHDVTVVGHSYRDAPGGHVAHVLDRVPDQIAQKAQIDTCAACDENSGYWFEVDFDARVFCIWNNPARQICNDLRDARTSVRIWLRAGAREVEKTRGDRIRPRQTADDAIHVLSCALVGGAAKRQFRRQAGGRERVSDVVRNTAGELLELSRARFEEFRMSFNKGSAGTCLTVDEDGPRCTKDRAPCGKSAHEPYSALTRLLDA